MVSSGGSPRSPSGCSTCSRGQVAHTLLLHADDDASLERSARLAVEIRNLTHGQVGACLVLGA
ncbi:hypothetical protein [Streptomyces xantholiticus]|uniref:Uncharacterized protein n=1 Tax=Streptomyces xantholiticus TaxID=68285 RepID=A0ABV1UZL8_9ACTN